MQERSFAEWNRNFDDSGDEEVDDTMYTGILKCFCDQQQLDPKFTSSDTFEGKRSNGIV